MVRYVKHFFTRFADCCCAAVLGLLMIVLTTIVTIRCNLNFGRGLKEHLNKKKDNKPTAIASTELESTSQSSTSRQLRLIE